MFFAYILFSQFKGKFYFGHTHDLEKRLKAHNAGIPRILATKGDIKKSPRDMLNMLNSRDFKIKDGHLEKMIKRAIVFILFLFCSYFGFAQSKDSLKIHDGYIYKYTSEEGDSSMVKGVVYFFHEILIKDIQLPNIDDVNKDEFRIFSASSYYSNNLELMLTKGYKSFEEKSAYYIDSNLTSTLQVEIYRVRIAGITRKIALSDLIKSERTSHTIFGFGQTVEDKSVELEVLLSSFVETW